MRLVGWFISQATVFVVVLGVSLSGYGMAQAHTAAMKFTSDVASVAGSTDHSSHKMHMMSDHASHDMSTVEHGKGHEGHSNCPMIACCHSVGAGTPDLFALADPVSCKYSSSANPQLSKAEPESAKKPPKHV